MRRKLVRRNLHNLIDFNVKPHFRQCLRGAFSTASICFLLSVIFFLPFASPEFEYDLKPQIREQMSGPEILSYGKSILGCWLWPGLHRGKKGSGPILSNFFGRFFQFFMGKKIEKNFFENIAASALKSCIEKR